MKVASAKDYLLNGTEKSQTVEDEEMACRNSSVEGQEEAEKLPTGGKHLEGSVPEEEPVSIARTENKTGKGVQEECQTANGKEKMLMEGSAGAETAKTSYQGMMTEATSSTEGPVQAEQRAQSVVIKMENIISRPRIRWFAPEWMKNMTNKDAYQPTLVSLGSIHCAQPSTWTMPMEGSTGAEMAETSYQGMMTEATSSTEGPVQAEQRAQWVVMMENIISHPSQRNRWFVPEWMKNMTNKHAYRPMMVSLGTGHFARPTLMPMQEHKWRAVRTVARKMRQPDADALNLLASAIGELFDFLKEAYPPFPSNMESDAKMMTLMDGIFLLEIMRVYNRLSKLGEECPDYGSNDPVFSKHGFLSLYLPLRCDAILVENQLPLFLLQKLQEKITGRTCESKEINNMVLDFLGLTCNGSNTTLGFHPLGLLHRSFCGIQEKSREWGEWNGTMPNATELAEAGIQFKKCIPFSVHVIGFEKGVLTMPEVEVNDRTEKEFINLMAFELLNRGVGSNATAFMIFMDNLIDSERDVALLKSKGVIKNLLSSDKEAAKLFNSLSKGALLSPSSHLYNVQHKLNEHCDYRWNRWRANFVQIYLKNPWVFSAFVASVILLIATFLQTIYTVMPLLHQELAKS
ncbi:hypothetical protein EJB05_02881, partial [Eragrostis curvula]